jgi:hypothetical protein
VVAIVIAVVIAILPDHDGIVAIPVVALPDHFSIAIPITVATDGSDGHAAWTHANSNFFRASRHCDANSSRRDGHHYKTPHHSLLSL